MRKLLLLFLLLSSCAAAPILEMTAPSSIKARKGIFSEFSATVKNKGDSEAKNVSFSIVSPWEGSRNSIFPPTPEDINAGWSRNYTIKVKPPFEGSYKILIRAESVQGVKASKEVAVNVAFGDLPLEEPNTTEEKPEPSVNETSANTTTENATVPIRPYSPPGASPKILYVFFILFMLGLLYVIRLELTGG